MTGGRHSDFRGQRHFFWEPLCIPGLYYDQGVIILGVRNDLLGAVFQSAWGFGPRSTASAPGRQDSKICCELKIIYLDRTFLLHVEKMKKFYV